MTPSSIGMDKTGTEGIATFQAVHNFQFVHHIIVECAASISNSGEVVRT